MAKAKILADRFSITSDVLTDETIERISLLAPSVLKLYDERDEKKVLFEVAKDDCTSLTNYGAVFKNGKAVGTIAENIMEIEDTTVRNNKITNLITAILTRINVIEEQVEAYLEDAIDLADDIEFLD